MKPFLSVILAAVLVIAVAGSLVNGTMAGFFDVEHSTDNYMCAGTRCLEVSGGPIVVEHAWPCQWYEEEYILINTGSLDSTAYIHFPAEDGSVQYNGSASWHGIKSEEAGTVNGLVYDGTVGYRTPVGVEPIGEGVATTEPELTAEEGGIVGEKADGTAVIVPGLGVDTCNLADFIEVKVWFDGVLKVNGNLSDIASTDWELGLIPASPGENEGNNGEGWGSYFEYHVSGGPIKVSLVGGQVYSSGIVTISDDGTNLYVDYDTTGTGWKLTQTHVYVGIDPPPKLSPGKFKDWGGAQHDSISPPREADSYTFSLSQIGAVPGTDIYLAVHAVVYNEELDKEETAWGNGVYRKVRIEIHFPDIDEDDLFAAGVISTTYFDENDPNEAKWDHWPTNAYMGDLCIFDVVFLLEKVPPNNGCNECKGKVTQLTLQYNGSEDATIKVEQNGKNGGTVFDGIVEGGAQFTFTGMDKNGALGTEISIYVNEELNTKIHTSCSKPIGPGLVSGAFEVVEGYSKDGGLLCPIKPPPNGCNKCKGKVTQLTLQYNGSEDATIKVEQNGKNGGTVFEGVVEAGTQFTFTGMDKNGTLGTEISIYVNEELNTKIHTSCSKPIGPGLVSGAFEVVEGYSKDGGLLCPIKPPPGRRR